MVRWEDPAGCPTLPTTEIVSHVGITDQSQRQIGVRGAIAALAVRNHFFIRKDVPLAHTFCVSSSADLKNPYRSRFCVHSRCTAPGIAPPRAARTNWPVYSASLRVSTMTVDWNAAVASHIVCGASSSRRCFILKLPAFGTRLRALTGKPAAVQALNPPFRT